MKAVRFGAFGHIILVSVCEIPCLTAVRIFGLIILVLVCRVPCLGGCPSTGKSSAINPTSSPHSRRYIRDVMRQH